MRKENFKTIMYLLIFVMLAMLVIFFDDLMAMMNEMVMEQTDSLMDQLLR